MARSWSRDAVLEWLDARVNYERLAPSGPGGTRSFALGRMRRLLALLGDPHRDLAVVHVAGTKGKGSTVAMIASILRHSGYRVGRYLSPHVRDIEERIAVDGRPVPRSAFVAAFAAVIPAVARLDAEAARRGGRGPTWFEVLTAAAFRHFAAAGVDVVVLETGLGGRLDATNVCRPLVSVITPVSLDHTAVLGPTVGHIAAEKAGIIKRGRPVVCGARDPAAREVVERVARRRRCPIVLVDTHFRADYLPPADATALAGGTLVYSTLAPARGLAAGEAEYRLAMTGRHQADNAALAVTTARLLRSRGFTIPETAVRRGLLATRLPARIERISDAPRVVVDAAHNVASVKSLVEAIAASLAATAPRGGRNVLVFAASGDKPIEEMLAAVAGSFDRIVLTRAVSSPRSAPLDRLVAASTAAGIRSVETAEDPPAALARARRIAGPEGFVCVAGSFFLAGEVGGADVTRRRPPGGPRRSPRERGR